MERLTFLIVDTQPFAGKLSQMKKAAYKNLTLIQTLLKLSLVPKLNAMKIPMNANPNTALIPWLPFRWMIGLLI